MRFLSKKECPDLLACLGEESWCTAKTNETENTLHSVAWVQERIVTIQSLEGYLLLRVIAVLSTAEEELVKQRMERASHRDSGSFHFSVRKLEGFLLAQVECYEAMEAACVEAQVKMLYQRLEDALSGP